MKTLKIIGLVLLTLGMTGATLLVNYFFTEMGAWYSALLAGAFLVWLYYTFGKHIIRIGRA